MVKINERTIVDWSGKIGRNEEGRIPYFKAGIYNPSGYAQNAEVWIRNFAYNCSEEPCAETRTHDKCFEKESVLNRLVRVDENQIVENDVLSRESRGSRSKEVCSQQGASKNFLIFRNGRNAKKKRKSVRGGIVKKKRNEKQRKAKKKREKRN